MIQSLREQAAVGAPGGCTQGDLVTIEGLAPPSPADPGGQAEGLERPKAEEVLIPKEEVDWTEDKPEEPKKRRKIKRSEKKQRKAEKEAARRYSIWKQVRKEAKKAKKEANKKLQKSEPDPSTAIGLEAAWESGNEESEGKFSFLSSTSCNLSPEKGEEEEEGEPIRLKSVAKEPIRLKSVEKEPILLRPTAKHKTVRLKPTSKKKSICLKSVERDPIRLRSVIRPTTTRRQSCIDEKTGIEHRLSDTGRWLPVLGSAHRTGKERKAKTKARKSKAPSQAPAEAFDPGVQNQYLWKPPKEESCGSGLTRAYWRERASGSGSAGSKE